MVPMSWIVNLLLCILIAVQVQAYLNTKDRLQLLQDAKKVTEEKSKLLLHLVGEIQAQHKLPAYLVPESWGRKNHTVHGPAVFAAAFSSGFKRSDATRFCGSLLNTGFNGDIVLAVLPNPDSTFTDALRKMANVIMYTVPLKCRQYRDVWCHFHEEPGYTQISIKTIRFRLYQWWSTFYHPSAMLMLSDYRDVFFQSNPFTYHPDDWSPPRFQLVVFQEVFFNIIGRCPYHTRWITDCYGIETLQKFQTLPIICSGVTMGKSSPPSLPLPLPLTELPSPYPLSLPPPLTPPLTELPLLTWVSFTGTRDAIMAYTYFINQQLQPDYRLGHNTTGANHNRCMKGEVDQAFHDFLIYEKVLDTYMDVKIFAQGECPTPLLINY